jgi:hypothetical protein
MVFLFRAGTRGTDYGADRQVRLTGLRLCGDGEDDFSVGVAGLADFLGFAGFA